MDDEIPIDWSVLTPIEKNEIMNLLRRVGIEGVRELLAYPRQMRPSKG